MKKRFTSLDMTTNSESRKLKSIKTIDVYRNQSKQDEPP